MKNMTPEKLIANLPPDVQEIVAQKMGEGMSLDQILGMLQAQDQQAFEDGYGDGPLAFRDRKVVIPPGTSTVTSGVRG